MIIAVDGPAASGKGTIAKALARHYGLAHMDTGALYRAVGLAMRRAGADPQDSKTAAAIARDLDVALLDEPDLRTSETAAAASIVSAHPAVRAALLDRQRMFARQPGGAVLDGRDIGTVIAPDADAKLFVTARAEVRAQRRQIELERAGQPLPFDAVLADIRSRDERDSARSAAPLVQAPDSALLDTSDLDIEAAIRRAIALVEDRIGSGAAQSASRQ